MRPSTESGGGKRAGRYVLGDLLGRGGMAEVFAGFVIGDHGFQKPVAIKRLLPELASDRVFVDRLIQEAKLLVGMQHGNIVSVLDLARDGEDVFLVMEFVDGPSLRQLIRSRGSKGISLASAAYIVQSAAAGLEFAHARPGGAIIHADISPSNLLLTTSGEVRVADFGIARREGGGHGIVEGKWAYMAPEQARGEPLSPRSDVFALGVVLYELITGAHPFGHKVTPDAREHEPVRVIPPRVVKPSIPPGLDAICMRALADDPRDRYARMQHMIDAIMDERFANQWREGAADLATAIREGGTEPTPSGGFAAPRTMITERPVTIVTRSLIELTPARRSSKRLGSPPPAALVPSHTPPPVLADELPSRGPSTEPASSFTPAEDPADGMSTPYAGVQLPSFEIPPALRTDAPMMPAFRMSQAVMHGADLASVHGGTQASLHMPAVAPIGAASSSKWAFITLGLAAVLGVVAAVVLSLGPTEVQAAAEPERVAKAPIVTPSTDLADAISTAPSAEPAAVREPTIPPGTVIPPEPTPAITQPMAPPVPSPATDETPAPRTTEPARDKTPKRPPAPARAKQDKEPGTLRLSVAPWGWVTIDGGSKRDGNGSFKLAPGRHQLRAFNDDGTSLSKTVYIESNRVKTIKFRLDDEIIQELD